MASRAQNVNTFYRKCQTQQIVTFRLDTKTQIMYVQCSKLTMWKFQDFSITQILRENNLGDSRSAKSAILTHL